MKQEFPEDKFGQRWQVESVFSRFKRRLDYALGAKLDQPRAIECLVRVSGLQPDDPLFTFSRSVAILRYFPEQYGHRP